MKKHLLSFLIMFTIGISHLQAQSTAQIGTENLRPPFTYPTLYSPFFGKGGDLSTSIFMQHGYIATGNILYTPTELNAAGIFAGAKITALSFKKLIDTGYIAADSAILRFYMLNSNTLPPLDPQTTWASIEKDFTLVYENLHQKIPAVAGFITFNLNTPFYYTGGSLEIANYSDLNHLTKDDQKSAKFVWEYSSGTANNILGYMNTNSSPTNPPVILSGWTGPMEAAYKNRPNILFTFFDASAGCAIPVAGEATAYPAQMVTTGASVSLDLKNNMVGSLQTYQWQTSFSATGSFTNIGPSFTTGGFVVKPAITTFYRCAVTCGSTTSYSTPVEVPVFPTMAGTFTVDKSLPTNNRNFASFADLTANLGLGISGPVTINLAANSGPYIEQLIIKKIPGASAVNPVTINGNNNTVSFLCTDVHQKAVVKLDGASYVTVNGFNIKASGEQNFEYGFGVHLLNNADNNTISNCNIATDTGRYNTDVNLYAGIVINAYDDIIIGSTNASINNDNVPKKASNCDSNLITGNTITGGLYGIVVNGGNDIVYKNTITNNTVTNFATYGIHLYNFSDGLVEGNDISRPVKTHQGSIVYSIFLSGSGSSTSLFTTSIRNRINQNRIHNMFGGYPTRPAIPFYGIYLQSTRPLDGDENVVSNNLIYDINNSTNQYGLYNSTAENIKYYHNTISLDDKGATGGAYYGFYQVGVAKDIELINNNITIGRGGTTPKYCEYWSTPATTFTASNNNLFITSAGGTGKGIAYKNAIRYTSILDWQTASAADANSVSIDPVYKDTANGDYTPTNPAFDNLGTPGGIGKDLLDVNRSGTTPDMGAYEFGIISSPLPVTLISFTAQNYNKAILVNWATSNETNSSHFEVEQSLNGNSFHYVGSVTANMVATSYSFTDLTPAAGTSYYRLKIVDKDGKFRYSNIVKVNTIVTNELKVFPNPATSTATLYHGKTSKNALVRIIALDGRMVQQQSVPVNATQTNINVNSLGAGQYILELRDKGQSSRIKLIRL